MAARVKKDETPSKPKYRYRVMNWAEYDLALDGTDHRIRIQVFRWPFKQIPASTDG